ncbi:MAG: PVC-type heme-binding CxxCH protein [Roseibacillus sp.]
MKSLALLSLLAFCLPSLLAKPLVYEGTKGLGKGKHLVFIASDHEYRSEETLPALARILAKHHGFKCTVCFGVDENGELKAGHSNIPGLEALKSSDLMVIFTRFQNLPDDQMVHIVDYLDRGGPVVGLRTSSHAFKIPANAKYASYDFRSKVSGYENGFGHQVLGNTWVGHYGRNHKQGTRIKLVPGQKDHPILKGVADNAFTHAGAYTGIAADDFTVLTMSQPLVSMDKDAAPDKTKKPVPSTWTRHYQSKSGKNPRVFHTTQGASEDILDDDYRRLVCNGILWALELENSIKPDLNFAFVGPYTPTTFGGGAYVRGVKPEDLAGWKSPILPRAKENPPARKADRKKRAKKPTAKSNADGKNRKLNKPSPGKDPELAKHYINLKGSPRAAQANAMATSLPLTLQPDDQIAFIGSGLFDNARHHGYFESLLHQRFPKHQLSVRNFSWPADEIDLQPRPANFGDLDQHLTYFQTDVIFAAFGYNESFAGKPGLPAFRARFDAFLSQLKSRAYNGKTAARIIVLSPTANENIAGVPAADLNNANLKLYTDAMAVIARKHNVAFADIYSATATAMADKTTDHTSNGNQLNDTGQKHFANTLYRELFEETAPAVNEKMRTLVKKKAFQFFHRYRPLNTFYYTGGRNKSYGYLDFLPAMRNFDLMVDNRNKAIWSTALGKSTKVDDSNLPALNETTQSRGANEWLSAKDELAAFKVDPRFEVNCFASEEDFPDIACPIQMRWDARGRLWVSCSTTYPHLYPGRKPSDKIVILEDTDWDGVADKSTVFADDLEIPLSFVLGNGGVYVSEEPHLIFLKDTDGDDKADVREVVLTGFGCEDSHHALHDFVWTPDGDLLFRESIFHNSQVETAYGPVRAKNSSWFRFRPDTQKLTAFGGYPNTNPWGVTFDDWGHHVASHPVFASAFHATNAPYPSQHPRANGIPAYSGVCGHEFVDFASWPDDLQDGFVKVRYKPSNRVEFHKWVEHDDHFREEYQFDLIFSTNLSFIPVDLRYGPRGAMYVCDWYNPIKGHAQYSLRDPRRDRKSGRIWRIVPKGAKLQDPPAIAGQPIPALLDLLKRPEYRYRYWAKRELRDRKFEEVNAALVQWVAKLDPKEKRYRHHQVEALWIYRGIGAGDPDLLKEVLACKVHLARAAATRQLRYETTGLSIEERSALLRERANDENGIVRMEAATAATYLATPVAFAALLDTLKHPRETHLTYAIRTALGAKSMLSFWDDGDPPAAIAQFLQSFNKSSGTKAGSSPRNAQEADFDSQKGLKVVKIGCIPERLLFTLDRFEVTPNQPVKLILTNPDATQHNLLVLDRGASVEEIGMAANEMAKSPDGVKKHFIPNDKRILHYTKLLDPNTSETLRFRAPSKPGTYPYLCTFPGHWILMKGEMIVK